jgi:hypothetical protein
MSQNERKDTTGKIQEVELGLGDTETQVRTTPHPSGREQANRRTTEQLIA